MIYFQIGLTAFVIASLIFTYKKYKTENEEFLAFKIIGYYLLGAFRFNFNNLAIPLGFIIYIMFFKPSFNKLAKKMAAGLGLLIFIIGVITPLAYQAYYELPKEVSISSDNVYEINFKDDWKAINEKINTAKNARIEDFNIGFKPDGSISNLRYDIIGHQKGKLTLYRISFDSRKKRYIIKPLLIDEWLQYPRLIRASYFFEVLDTLEIEKILSPNASGEQIVQFSGESITSSIRDREYYQLIDGELKKIEQNSLPIQGYSIFVNSRNSKINRIIVFK